MARQRDRDREKAPEAKRHTTRTPDSPPDVPEYRYAEILEARRGEGPGPDTTRDLTDEYVTGDEDGEREGIDAVDNFTGATPEPVGDTRGRSRGEPGSRDRAH